MGAPSLMNNDHMNINTYKKMKVRMIEKDFMITLTQEQKDHINELQSEIAIDNYCRKIFSDFYGD